MIEIGECVDKSNNEKHSPWLSNHPTNTIKKPVISFNNLKAKRLWKDMKKDAEIIADGETIYKNGKWLPK